MHFDAARCHDANSVLFSPVPSDERTIATARMICARCEIRLDCLAEALRTPGVHGIWGGLTDAERAVHTKRATPTP